MATVTGNFGGQPIELNNAATEATLKELVTAVGILAAKTGKDIKSQAQLERELKKFQDQLGKATKSAKDADKQRQDEHDALKKAKEAIDNEKAARDKATKATDTNIAAMKNLGSAFEGTISKLSGFMSQVAGMGNSFTGAASIFSNLPIVGGLLGSVFGNIASSGEKVYTSFKQSASVGANFNGSIRDMVNAASGAGLTMDQFSGIVQKNGENLMFLGGTTTDGAKRLAQLGKSIRNTQLGDELARLGYSTEEINSGMAQFGGMMAKSGKQMDNAALAKSSAEYLKNLDAVSRLTGKNKEALQAEADARMADSQYRLMLAKLDPEGAANLEMLMNAIPKEHQAGLKEILATGTAVSDEAQAAMYYMNQTGQSAMALGQTMRQTGTLTKEQTFAFDEARRAEMKTIQEQAKAGDGLVSTLGMFGNTVQQNTTLGILNTNAAETLRQAHAKQTKELEENSKKQKDSLDPAAMKQFQEDIAKMSNKINVLLAQNMDKLMSAFNNLSTVIDFVSSGFDFLMKHFETVVAGIVAFKLAIKAVELNRLLNGPGAKPTNPMFVHDVAGGGGGGDGGGSEKGKGKGKGGRMKGFLKGGGLAIAGMGLGMAGDYAKEAGHEKTGAALDIGAETATWAGTGAMLGSVVPGLGTAVGAGIGAAGGAAYGLYKNWSTIRGKPEDNVTDATVKPDDKLAQDWAFSILTGKASPKNIPKGYEELVNHYIKNPPAHWNEHIAGGVAPATAVTKTVTGSGVSQDLKVGTPGAVSATPATINYDAGPEELLKQAAGMYKSPYASAEFAKTLPASAQADAAKKAIESDSLKKKKEAEDNAMKEAEEKAKKEAEEKSKPPQEKAETLLAQLNNSMEQLLKVSKAANGISEDQLRVQRGFGSDLYASIG